VQLQRSLEEGISFAIELLEKRASRGLSPGFAYGARCPRSDGAAGAFLGSEVSAGESGTGTVSRRIESEAPRHLGPPREEQMGYRRGSSR
jgi:hypothetical protein